MAIEVSSGTGTVRVSSRAPAAKVSQGQVRASVCGTAWKVRASSPSHRVSATQGIAAVSVKSGVIADGVPYTGSYEVVPSGEEQVLRTTGMLMSRDVTVGPIPSNYGLITWNGSAITVS